MKTSLDIVRSLYTEFISLRSSKIYKIIDLDLDKIYKIPDLYFRFKSRSRVVSVFV